MKFVFEVIIHGDEIDAIVDKFGKKATEGALLEDMPRNLLIWLA